MDELISRPVADALFYALVPASLVLSGWALDRRGRARGRLGNRGLRLGVAAALICALGWAGLNAVLDRVGPGSVVGLAAIGLVVLGAGVAFGRSRFGRASAGKGG